MDTKLSRPARWLALLLLILLAVGGAGAATPSVLRVVIYPFVPERAGLFYSAKDQFERDNPGWRVDITDLSANYYDPSKPGAVTNTDADVYEIDTVLLQDMVDLRKIRPLRTFPKGEFLAVAEKAAHIGDTAYVVPHWVCANFLFYRAGDELADAKSLTDMEKLIGAEHAPGKGLLLDMKGKTTLGELYLDALFDYFQDPVKAMPYLDPENIHMPTVENLRRAVALCDKGFGRDEDYHDLTGFYPTQFASGRGRAVVGYTESMYYALFQNLLLSKDQKWNIDDFQVTDFPLSEKGSFPLAWVDGFGVSSKLTPETDAAAERFVNYMTSFDTVKNAITNPGFNQTPRYLSPARKDVFSDEGVLRDCPLYRRERATFDRAVSVGRANLVPVLRSIGAKVDGMLPAR